MVSDSRSTCQTAHAAAVTAAEEYEGYHDSGFASTGGHDCVQTGSKGDSYDRLGLEVAGSDGIQRRCRRGRKGGRGLLAMRGYDVPDAPGRCEFEMLGVGEFDIAKDPTAGEATRPPFWNWSTEH